jgi:hypothetical protein
MKTKFLLLLISTFLFIGCGDNKKADKPLAGSIQEDGTVKDLKEQGPTNQLLVINKTGQDFKANATYCMQKTDCDYVIKDGDSLLMQTNILVGTSIFTLYPLGPVGCDPVNGNASQTYGYWSGAGHITSNWDNNYSNPTPWHPATPGANWEFCFDFKNEGDPMKEEVTITICKSCK